MTALTAALAPAWLACAVGWAWWVLAHEVWRWGW